MLRFAPTTFALMAFAILAFLVTSTPSQASPDAVGFRELTIAANDGDRALAGAIWYPTADTKPPIRIGENPIFFGHMMQPDANIQDGRHPLVVMSHGFGGNWRNQAWLAMALARTGYVVAAINHPGTTSRDLTAEVGHELWLRPRDISHLITSLTNDTAWSPHLDAANITVIGHSLGGWTVLELAGARMDMDRMDDECQAHPEFAACDGLATLEVGSTMADRKMLAADLKDERIRGAISLDLGLARGFTQASLAAIDIPVLVIAAGAPNPKIPKDLESGYLIEHLPADLTRYHDLPGAAHFSFLPECKPNAAILLEQDVPGDGIICLDGGEATNRSALHQQTITLILDFLRSLKTAS
ncbi:alpha/beta fold hydrolase [Thalassospira sp. ER-Se-21-Dark]|uniref:alpha/beta hydrolase family protein n=1 Tax=Thalassospira sp. ER-Se-21-Dark TaxID=2585190 RepID=UPI001B313970|nr:alpha/beta fold hydrolase [Thalassospira sp. ER-Se-21-Dark]MBP3125731.1 alpha/beta fold hydrolase [Thalassospira sp. ER-Se-21-Dark]